MYNYIVFQYSRYKKKPDTDQIDLARANVCIESGFLNILWHPVHSLFMRSYTMASLTPGETLVAIYRRKSVIFYLIFVAKRFYNKCP